MASVHAPNSATVAIPVIRTHRVRRGRARKSFSSGSDNTLQVYGNGDFSIEEAALLSIERRQVSAVAAPSFQHHGPLTGTILIRRLISSREVRIDPRRKL